MVGDGWEWHRDGAAVAGALGARSGLGGPASGREGPCRIPFWRTGAWRLQPNRSPPSIPKTDGLKVIMAKQFC